MADFDALLDKLMDLRSRAVVSLAERSNDTIRDLGMVSLLGSVQAAIAAVEEVAEGSRQPPETAQENSPDGAERGAD